MVKKDLALSLSHLSWRKQVEWDKKMADHTREQLQGM